MSENRKPLTAEQKAHQRTLAKTKRLNLKLAEVKKIALHLEAVADKNQNVSPQQVKAWAKRLKTILNVKDDEQL
jgi:hypothetical protein